MLLMRRRNVWWCGCVWESDDGDAECKGGCGCHGVVVMWRPRYVEGVGCFFGVCNGGYGCVVMCLFLMWWMCYDVFVFDVMDVLWCVCFWWWWWMCYDVFVIMWWTCYDVCNDGDECVMMCLFVMMCLLIWVQSMWKRSVFVSYLFVMMVLNE